ncbi:MAG: NUDIX hydrolase [Planctomycetes bacterium]|nr:NUDIX hydrolase [Planctomycetota bacterium]
MSDPDFREPHLRHVDFLGAFGILRRGERILFVRNEREIDGRRTEVWDLPGGQVEAGELLVEALRRELREEVAVECVGDPAFAFVQEGERCASDRRLYAWRSFFFEVDRFDGEPSATSEVLGVRWMDATECFAELHAPYHDSFLRWLERGGRWFDSGWRD